jgi:small subunit ribosomal protein S15
MLTAATKRDVIQPYQQSEQDTGSTAVQIALLTARIRDLQGHFKTSPKDLHSLRGMMKLVSRRRKLLKYLGRQDREQYRSLLKALQIRD